jgi:hypothetical protein
MSSLSREAQKVRPSNSVMNFLLAGKLLPLTKEARAEKTASLPLISGSALNCSIRLKAPDLLANS